MAILQALIAFITRSAGKILNAIFGWAVLALFGRTSPKEQTVLSAVVVAAAVWPLLAIGVIFPRASIVALAFVPAAANLPAFWVRIAWIALALMVPFAVGTAIAKRSPDEQVPEPGWKRLLRGFPTTLALDGAFLLVLVIAPSLQIVNAVKRRKVVHVPGVVDKRLTAELMAAIAFALREHGIEVSPAEPPWYMTAPSKVLLKVGGRVFARMSTDRPEYRRGPELEVAVLPNEAVLRGTPIAVGRAQALTTEVFAPRPVIQTFNLEAQELEKQIKRVWAVYAEAPERHRRSAVLFSRVDEISADLAAAASIPWDEWQIVYRLLLQLNRSLHGEPPLLTHPKEGQMASGNERERLALPPAGVVAARPGRDALGEAEASTALEGLSNRELLSHILENAKLLAKKEIELAKTELRADLKREVAMAKGLGVAGVCALCVLNLILVACALALGTAIPEWAAALVVAAVVLAVGTVAGLVGWGKRVRSPLEATIRTVKEDVTWAKERLA